MSSVPEVLWALPEVANNAPSSPHTAGLPPDAPRGGDCSHEEVVPAAEKRPKVGQTLSRSVGFLFLCQPRGTPAVPHHRLIPRTRSARWGWLPVRQRGLRSSWLAPGMDTFRSPGQVLQSGGNCSYHGPYGSSNRSPRGARTSLTRVLRHGLQEALELAVPRLSVCPPSQSLGVVPGPCDR